MTVKRQLHNELFFARHLCRRARKNAAQNRSVLDVHEDSLERNIACAASTEANCGKEPLCSGLVNFDKMHGLGNDFVMIEASQLTNVEDIPSFCRAISHRKFGVGCDLVTIYKYDAKSATVDASFFNSDGSEAEICGNAARCLGLLMHQRDVGSTSVTLAPIVSAKFATNSATTNKTYQISIDAKNNVSVNFGKPTATVLSRRVSNQMNLSLIDDFHVDDTLWKSLEELGVYHISCLSVGNPHLIFFLKQMPSLDQAQYLGARFESDSLFPNKTNVSFAKVISENEIDLTVFERTDGLTLACGSGAMATAFAAYQRNFLKSNSITVNQRGGTLLMTINDDGTCIQTGRATHVFSGTNVSLDPFTASLPSERYADTIFNAEAESTKISESSVTLSASPSASSKAVNAHDAIIYTDGACSGNPGPGGWGALILSGDKRKELCGSEADTTNNRMEMMAAICALEYLKSPCKIDLYTDSTYVKNGITKWITNWQRKNWINSEGNPVKNKDLWLRLLEATKRHKISWHWVEGHAGNKYNEIVDKLARSQCKIR
ncbi:hypothetical protein FACS189472_05570 [Alphaproteobacteria bacterium]|nr:hypothetical protein FACS189472_05570 [Alphaproteobacteria bacterium]